MQPRLGLDRFLKRRAFFPVGTTATLRHLIQPHSLVRSQKRGEKMWAQSSHLLRLYKRNLRLSASLITRSSRRFYQSEINKYLSDFPPVYSQRACEQFWSDIWKKSELFAENKSQSDSSGEFRILLPPPNITGNLHLGNFVAFVEIDRLNDPVLACYRPLVDRLNSRRTMSLPPNEWKEGDLVRRH